MTAHAAGFGDCRATCRSARLAEVAAAREAAAHKALPYIKDIEDAPEQAHYTGPWYRVEDLVKSHPRYPSNTRVACLQLIKILHPDHMPEWLTARAEAALKVLTMAYQEQVVGSRADYDGD